MRRLLLTGGPGGGPGSDRLLVTRVFVGKGARAAAVVPFQRRVGRVARLAQQLALLEDIVHDLAPGAHAVAPSLALDGLPDLGLPLLLAPRAPPRRQAHARRRVGEPR